jgi:fluoride exporter
MINYILVFVGAGVGGMVRHGVNLTCARYCGLEFPWGTLIINIIGSGLMGLLVGWLAFRSGEAWTQHLRLFLATGILGGFTTFSTFSLDAVLLWERGDVLNASLYVAGSLIGGVLGLIVALNVMRALS